MDEAAPQPPPADPRRTARWPARLRIPGPPKPGPCPCAACAACAPWHGGWSARPVRRVQFPNRTPSQHHPKRVVLVVLPPPAPDLRDASTDPKNPCRLPPTPRPGATHARQESTPSIGRPQIGGERIGRAAVPASARVRAQPTPVLARRPGRASSSSQAAGRRSPPPTHPTPLGLARRRERAVQAGGPHAARRTGPRNAGRGPIAIVRGLIRRGPEEVSGRPTRETGWGALV